MGLNLGKVSTSDLEIFLELGCSSDLEKIILSELNRRNKLSKYANQSEFRSERLPDFNSAYMHRCMQLCLEFSVDRLPFMWRSACFDFGNNQKGDFYIGMFGIDKSYIDKTWMHNLGYLSLLFDDGLIQKYEGSYNTINYLINSVYRHLNQTDGEIDSVEQLFGDMPEKEGLVRKKLSDVAGYLWDVRSSVIGSRSSIANHGLTMNKNKTKKGISPQQSALIEAVAFGCSLNELNEGNYEGAKRLIYVPREKIRTYE